MRPLAEIIREREGNALKGVEGLVLREAQALLSDIAGAADEYLREMANPAPDPIMRKTHRDYLDRKVRALRDVLDSAAPAEPAKRRKKAKR